MGQPSVINLRTFDLRQKGTLACLCSLTLWEFSLLLRYSDVLVTAVLAARPILSQFTLHLTRRSSDIVTSVAPKHQKVLFLSQKRGAMWYKGTETGFGLKALGFSLGLTLS